MNLLMFRAKARVGYIIFLQTKRIPTIEDFILGSLGFYALRVGRTRMLKPHPCKSRLSRGKTSKLDSPLLKISSLNTTCIRTNKILLSLKAGGILKGGQALTLLP